MKFLVPNFTRKKESVNCFLPLFNILFHARIFCGLAFFIPEEY